MIYDPEVEVTCDNCSSSVYITPEYKYRDYSGNSGEYDTEDESIERAIINEHDWIVIDGKHYCCEGCSKQ